MSMPTPTPMASLPRLPPAESAVDVFETGHLWVTEFIDGDPLRLQLTDAGYLAFADATERFDHDAVPLRYREAVRMIRERFDAAALTAAVDDTELVTICGVVTHRRETPYDLDRLPAFFATGVHDASRDRYLAPDAAQQALERVGLPTLDPFEKERRAAYTDPTQYDLPDSRWRDGPVAGVVFENKAGGRAVYRRQDGAMGSETETDTETTGATGVFKHHVTPEWLAARIDACEPNPTVEAVIERALARLARETAAVGTEQDETVAELRSTLAARTAERLRERH